MKIKHFISILCATIATFSLLAAPTIDEKRVYEDFTFAKTGSIESPSAISISFALKFPSTVRAVTLHLKSGNGWFSTDISKFNPNLAEPVSLRIPLAEFTPEDNPGKITDSTAIRISAWMNAPCTGAIVLSKIAFSGSASIAVIRATEKSAPGETDFAAKMSARVESLLTAAELGYDIIGDDLSESDIAKFKVVFIPYSPKLSFKSSAALAKFAKSGGKLFVFYNASQTLAKAIGVIPGQWEQPKLPWSAIEYEAAFGAGRHIPYYAECAIPPAAAPGTGAYVAGWLIDANGRKTSRAALVASQNGAWFAHVPPRAYPAAVDAIKAIIGGGKASTRQKPISNLPKDKTVAAWLNTPFPRIKGGWKAAAPQLKRLGINTLFVHFQAADTLLPAVHLQGHDYLSEAITECRANGIKLHAWVTCFSLDGIPAGKRRDFVGRTLKGNRMWLDPTNAKNRDTIVSSLATLAKSGVDGIHMDYVRTDDFTPVSKEYSMAITEFVGKASAAVRKAKPGIQISAAVFPTPTAASHRNQDWPAWISGNLLDFVTPMIYTASPATFKEHLSACTAVAPASYILPGIGTGADESQIDSATAEKEIAHSASCRGVAFFALEDALLELLGE